MGQTIRRQEKTIYSNGEELYAYFYERMEDRGIYLLDEPENCLSPKYQKMLADNIFLWVASLPLGAVAGLVLGMPAFWVYFFLKFDQVLKAVWCVIRLRSGKWIKKVRTEKEI